MLQTDWSVIGLAALSIALLIGAVWVVLRSRHAAERDAAPQSETAPPAIAPARPLWLTRLPARVVFLDVETTGLADDDRIVTFAAISVETAPMATGKFELQFAHLIFDPGRKSHPGAERVHGYDDWTLRHQPFFAEYAGEIVELLNAADLIVAHNAEFDLAFICRELADCGHPRPRPATFCTMQAFRRSFPGERSGLDPVAARLGLRRGGQRHGALEDAWLAAMIFFALHDCPVRFPFERFPNPAPKNIREVPPRPEGKLPRRKRRPTPLSAGAVRM